MFTVVASCFPQLTLRSTCNESNSCSFLSLTQLSFTVRLLTGVLQGQRTGAMWLVAGAGQNDEGRGKWLLRPKEHYLEMMWKWVRIETLFTVHGWYLLKQRTDQGKNRASLLWFQILFLFPHVSINSNTTVTKQKITKNNTMLFCCLVMHKNTF